MASRLQHYFWTTVGFTLLFLLLFAAWSHGKSGVMVMVTEEWPPYRINDEKSPSGFRGIDIDIINALSEELQMTIEIQRHPWARALEMMRAGTADLITGIACTAEREVFMYYVPVSYSSVRPVFYTGKGKGHLIKTYHDLYGKSIGYSLHSAYFNSFDSDLQLNKIGLSTEIQLLQVLALQRLDIIIGTDPNISYDIDRLGFQDKLEPTTYQPPDKTDLFVAISRKSAAMEHAGRLEEALGEMFRNGSIAAITNAYR